MNTSQIWTALKSDPVTGKKFLGVFPADRLPKEIESYPKGFIANTDVSGKPGTHWVAFYFPSEGKAEFFDSYGQPPGRYHKFFRDYLKHYDWGYNKRQLQSIWTDVCGQYCIFYLSHRVRGYSMNKIVNMFDGNTVENDNKVSSFVSRHFHIETSVTLKDSIQSSIKFVVKA